MLRFHKTHRHAIIAELVENSFKINELQDALDLIAEIGLNDCNNLIISEKDFSPDFFDLKTGLAGEILQKFSNYRTHLYITGDFLKYKSKSLQDFIRECNRGNLIRFTDSITNILDPE